MGGKALIADIQHFSLHDGPGIRTTVFFKGCSLACKWCHNPETISKSPQLLYHERLCTGCGACLDSCPADSLVMAGNRITVNRSSCTACGACAPICPYGALEMKGRAMDIDSIVAECLLDRSYYKEDGGVTLSGGEATGQPEALFALMKALKSESINLVLDTCGFASSEVIQRTLKYVNLYYFDVKCIDGELHQKWTGVDNSIILANLLWILENGGEVTARIPIIPGFNDSMKEMEAIAAFLAPWGGNLNVHLLPYHSLGTGKYTALGMEYTLSSLRGPEKDIIESFVSIFRDRNLRVKAMSS